MDECCVILKVKENEMGSFCEHFSNERTNNNVGPSEKVIGSL